MSDAPDAELLEQFARNHSEAAFAELVKRHLGLVYSTAFRKTNNPQHAEDITQAVFIILAHKADSFGLKTVLPGWLYHTARLTAANLQRAELRRIRREQEAFMQSTTKEPATDALWRELSPLLEDAMAGLGASDRDAIVLRFFQNRSLADVGAALGASENAAKMRVSRALEKLRKFFAKRGVVSTTAVIAGVISCNSVQAAPPALANSVTAAAIAKGVAASTSTLTIVKGAFKIMAWTKMKTAIAVGVAILLAAGTTAVVVEVHAKLSWADDPHAWKFDSKVLAKNPEAIILRPTRFKGITGAMTSGRGDQSGFRIEFENVPLKFLFASAHFYDEDRTILPNDAPRGNFDFMFTLPGNFDDAMNALKLKVKKQFGLVAHVETREVNVLVAKAINPNAPGLKISNGREDQQIGNFRDVVFKGARSDTIINWLEAITEMPVLNQTGLNNYYDATVRWRPHRGQSEKDAILKLLPGQFGLELVPTNMPIEMLVVEKAD